MVDYQGAGVREPTAALSTVLDDARHPAEAQEEIRKSRFIAQAIHSESRVDGEQFVRRVRADHPKARHVAFGAVWGRSPGSLAERMSDDAEPSGTAGRPILGAIRARGLTDCVVTVTRYFGGILLGSGGLIRAYASAASAALAAARQARIVPCRRLSIELPYSQYEPCRRLIARCGGTADNVTFTQLVRLVVIIPMERCGEFLEAFRQGFASCPTPVSAGSPVTVAIPVHPRGGTGKPTP